MKYLLDTNAMSEPARPAPDRLLLDRIRIHSLEICTCTPVLHELVYGIARLPRSARRAQLENYLESLIAGGMEVLPYEVVAARWHAKERARLASAGQTPSFVDGQIAAIAATNDLILVTRNIAEFRSFRGLQAVSWWSPPSRATEPRRTKR